MSEHTNPRTDRRGALTRRAALGAAGAAGAVVVLGRGRLGIGPGGGGGSAAAQTASCVLTPEKTEGPYFVDERLDRSDIRSNSDGTGTRDGVPLELTIKVLRVDEDCAPAAGVVVDVWHADADGAYSDIAQNGTEGQDFLRGLQVTDASGSVTFRTIYPGWYAGRTIHIHFKVRTFESDGNSYEFTSQLFFSDTANAAVVATDDYDDRGEQDTTNSEDSIYGGDTELLVQMAGDPESGFAGEATVGLSGLPDTGNGGASGDDVGISLLSTRFETRRDGTRVLRAAVRCDERVDLKLAMTSRGDIVARLRRRSLPAGRHTLRAIVAPGAKGPKARLRLTAVDTSGGRKRIRRRLRIPAGGRGA
jgi:protocatechuate 3,4-dioxygenase beta subunit